MAKAITDLANTVAPTVDYPFGQYKDETGANDGTPANVDMFNDMAQFFQKLMAEAGVTPNGLRDNEADGFQLFEALGGNVVKKYTKEVAAAFDGEVVSITRSEIESSFGDLNPFYKGALGTNTTESPFTDVHVKVYFLQGGLWKDFENTGNLITSISESTGNITLVLDAAPIDPAVRARIVIIG